MTILQFKQNLMPDIYEECISESNELQSNRIFDKVNIIKTKKPDPQRSGLTIKNPSSMKLENITADKVMLSESSNLHKQRGDFVSNEYHEYGFVRLPRNLLQSSGWRDLRMKQQKFFLYILQRVQFTPKKEKNNGKEIIVMPGQLFISYRSLVQDYNSNVKYKAEKIDLSFLQRAVSAFLANGWANTQTDTGITLITITQSDLYEHFKSLTDTQSDTETIQRRYNEKERKERKEEIRLKEAIVVSPLSDKNKKEKEYQTEESVFSDSKNKFRDPEFKESIEIIKMLVDKYKMPITEKEIIRWVYKYTGYVVVSNMNLLIPKLNKVDRPGAWMETALKGDWAKLKKNEPINKKFAEDFRDKTNWSDLKINKKYCTIMSASYDLQFNFEPEIFKDILTSKYENLVNR